MSAEAFVALIVIVTAAGLIAYRVLARRGEREVAIGGGRPEAPAAPITANVRTIMMVLVSVAVLGSSLFILLSGQYDSESQKWAFGVIGTIVGFWLRPEK